MARVKDAAIDLHNKYDSMSVRALMKKAVDIGTQYGHAVWKDGCEEMDALESALRKAVVKEASVGEIEVTVRESGDDLSRPGDPNRIVTASEQFICQTWIPEGAYYLIPKDKP